MLKDLKCRKSDHSNRALHNMIMEEVSSVQRVTLSMVRYLVMLIAKILKTVILKIKEKSKPKSLCLENRAMLESSAAHE